MPGLAKKWLILHVHNGFQVGRCVTSLGTLLPLPMVCIDETSSA